MAENEEKTLKDWLKIILPRVLRAAFWGFIMGGELLILPYLIPSIGGGLLDTLPIGQTDFSIFLFICIGFEVAIQLLRGTIFRYVLAVTRALISIIFLVLITNGGIISFVFSSSPQLPIPPGVVLQFTVDFRFILGAFLTLSVLSIIKNLIQAVDFVSEKAEEPVIPPELP